MYIYIYKYSSTTIIRFFHHNNGINPLLLQLIHSELSMPFDSSDMSMLRIYQFINKNQRYWSTNQYHFLPNQTKENNKRCKTATCSEHSYCFCNRKRMIQIMLMRQKPSKFAYVKHRVLGFRAINFLHEFYSFFSLYFLSLRGK